ncbi:WYL domain-containing protein [Gelidibacter sp.]|uniref:helix-turn-helix transcriptional regulator n=1 Tax=Gelidibacter sp. TaxID=2018083 RepID=UPI003266ADF5
MSTYKVLKRLKSIAQLVKSNPDITKKQLLERLRNDYDFNISERSFERDKNILESDFGIAMTYCYNSHGYSMEENEDALSHFFKFSKFAAMAELYESGLKDYKSFQKWVLPEDSSDFTGVQHFEKLIHAISINHKLTFLKENYYGGTKKAYTVSPLCLKEYANRWYLIAVADGENEIRNFGIDRLSDLKIQNENALKMEDFLEQLQQYDDVVGLNYSDSSIEDIEMRAHNNQIKYLRSLPIHKSQFCQDGADDWGIVTYKLKPNYEFIMQILKLGPMVEVLKPQSLRDQVKAHIDEMYQMYH